MSPSEINAVVEATRGPVSGLAHILTGLAIVGGVAAFGYLSAIVLPDRPRRPPD